MKSNSPNITFELLHKAIEQSPTSIVVTDKTGSIQYVNSHFTKLSGYTHDEVVGQNPRILKSDFHTPEYYREMWNTLSKGTSWSGLFKNKKKSGEYYWERAHINPVKSENGEITHFIAVKRDVTSEIENKIRSDRRERLLNDIQVLSRTGGWEYDVPSKKMYWTDELFELHGVPLDYEGDLLELVKLCVHPDDRDLIIQSFRKCVNDGIDYDHVVRYIDRNNVRKWVRSKSRAIKEGDGPVLKVIGSVRDVTDEVETFKAVQNSEARFKAVVGAFDDIVFTLDRKGRHTELFGHWAENEYYRATLIGKTSEQVMGEEAGKVHMDAFKNALQGLTVTYDWSSLSEKGITEYYQTKLTPLVIDDHITGILGVGRNISNEVKNQQKLKETSDRLSYALKGTQAGTWDWYIKTGKTIFNDRWAEMLGYRISELEPTTIDSWQKLTHPQDILRAEEQLNRHFEGGSDFYDVRYRMRHKNGDWVWVWDRGQVVERDAENKPVRMVGTHVDVTEWMKAEEKLKRSEKRYRDLFNESSDASLLFKNDRIFDCNQAAVDLLGYSSIEELTSLHPLDMAPEYQPDGSKSSTRYAENVKNATSNRSHRFELYHKRKDGVLIPLEVTTTLLQDVDGEELVYIIWRNISSRLKAENELKDSLKEKETLLSEVHHRVKNNLAVISALMQLQLYSQDDPLAEEILSKSINRIKSIALIHEQLYKSERFSGISLKENIERQTETVLDMYSDKLAAKVNLHLDLEDVIIDINKAMPVGLLLNEILNNTFKHAFKGKSAGNIYIKLEEADNEVHLIIKDDGVGFDPVEFEDGTTSLGNTLIKTFLDQLNASYLLKSNGGTAFDIRFSVS
jgi:PAS domain S-box-containing protein